MMEKAKERKVSEHLYFTDFKSDFDSLCGETLFLKQWKWLVSFQWIFI